MVGGRPICALVSSLLFSSASFAQSDSDQQEFSRGELFSIIRNAVPGSDFFSLPRNFRFPEHARDQSTFGIDFSHHVEESCQCQVDWPLLSRQKVRFAYLKATQGSSFVDRSALPNAVKLQQFGQIETGVYHFFTAHDEPQKQIDHFVS